MSQKPEVVALVSCVKTKQSRRAAARDLYISPLFRGMRCYAEAVADRWFILSAKHGLLEPGKAIRPYELTLKNMPRVKRAAWAYNVAEAIERAIPAGARLLVLAGSNYLADLEPQLRIHYRVELPMAGLTMGQRLRWLKRANGT